ncbi:MAG TPA: methyltransferase domain-containing protein, partial [Plasticicumulans sp.]|nr:methyltransferase domain-containing protein [Plasticicumulans sp.]
MPVTDRDRWDARYRDGIPQQRPCATLTAHLHLLPARGRALDLACGTGANARVLAAVGLDTEAWDVSPVAIG